MALYTSYYTRQLALRAEAGGPADLQQEGEKTLQKTVDRRTVDFTAPYVEWLQRRHMIRCPADTPAVPPVAAGALQLMPPAAYAHQPATSFAIKFAGQAPSKTRSSINVAVWTPDGRRCLTGTQAGEFTMWSGTNFQFETIIQAHETPTRAMAFTHNGNFLVSGDDGGTVRYWKTNLELVKSLPAHREAVRQLAFAPGDLKFATASDDSTVRVWDFARCAAEQVLAGHGGDAKCVGWHPHKALLVSGSKDGLVKLWCPKSGRCLATLHGHKSTIMQTEWNGNGNWVLTASRDQTCKLYDVRMQRELASFRGHNKDVTYATWHPLHEELFVSGGHDGSMLFWLASRQAPQAEVRGAHEASIWTAAWHPAGHLLATGAADFAVKFWCRCRPGDPFFDAQQEEQRELAAMAAEAEPVAAPRPAALSAPAASFGPMGAAAGGAIPGIGDAVAMPTLPQATATPFDVFSIRQQPYEERGGRPPADGGPAAALQRPGGRSDDPRSRRRERERSPEGDRKRRRSRSPPPQPQQQQPQQSWISRPPPPEPMPVGSRAAFIPIPRRQGRGGPPPAFAGPPPFRGGPPQPGRGGPPPFAGRGGPPPFGPPGRGGPPPPFAGRGRGRGGHW